MTMIYISSIVIIICIISCYFTILYSPNHTNNDGIDSPSLSLSTSIKEKFYYRSLRLVSTDSLKDDQFAVVSLASLPNKNIHEASIQHKNDNVVHVEG